MSDEDFMREAVDLARANIRDGGRPFAALLEDIAGRVKRERDAAAAWIALAAAGRKGE